MRSKPTTWGDIFWRWVHKGSDHGYAAHKADEWEKRHGTKPQAADREAGEAAIENRFTYHAPKGDQPARYESLRAAFKDLAYMVEAACPDSRERSLALTKLEEAVMWANAAIARNE